MQEKLVRYLEKKIAENEFRLHSLLEVTNAINSNQDVQQLLRLFEFILTQQIGVKKIVLFHKQQDWQLQLKVGTKGKAKGISVEKDLLRFKDTTLIESSFSPSLNEFEIVIPIIHKKQALAYLLLSGLKNLSDDLQQIMNEISFIQTLTNIIVVAIENKRMAKIALVQERIGKELEVASEMQKLLFPDDLPSNKRMDISAKYVPRHEVGGDYYDFIQLNDEEFLMCIADVSGKGISAAMLMANFQATIRTLFSYQRFDLKFLLEELNKKVMKSAKGEKFITFFIALYNSSTRELKYVNAGHNAPILTNGRKHTLLDKGCIGLGMLDEIPTIQEGKLILTSNNTIVMYTDGIVELENEKGEQFEIDRLWRLIKAYYPLKMEDLNNIIFSKLDEWKGKREFDDDTAIFCCRFF